MTIFFYGTLCDADLLRVVMGREGVGEPAVLADHAVHWADGGAFPVLVAREGAEAPGVVLRGLSHEEAARLDWYVGGFKAGGRDLEVQVGGEAVTARVYGAQAAPGAAWDLGVWRDRFGAAAVAAAGDVMALMGRADARAVAARQGQMLVRGAGRVRARQVAPVTRRHAAGDGDVAVVAVRQPYAHFFCGRGVRSVVQAVRWQSQPGGYAGGVHLGRCGDGAAL